MGLLRSLLGLDRARLTAPSEPFTQRAGVSRRRVTRGHIEALEPRQMLAANGLLTPQVLLGSVYFEEATGDDSAPDIIEVSYVGGAAGTTLDRIIISGDKGGDGLSAGDVFFDIADGGLGLFNAVGLKIESSDGFEVTGVTVVDGGTEIIINFSGFDAGEVLRFSIDVDEVQYVEPGAVVGGQVVDIDGVDVNSLVEGAEFQRSIITGEFSAVGYVDLTLTALYWDAFDGRRTAAETATGLELTLPDDRYTDHHDYSDRTAGAVAHAAQIPLATLAGWVYHDRSDDGQFNRGSEEGIGGVTVELLDANGNPTGITTVTSSEPGKVGYYEFRNLTAGTYGVREVQPSGWLDGKDTPGSHGGTAANESSGRVDRITGATLDFGDNAVEYNFGELLVGSIAGHVFATTGPDCDFENPEMRLQGVTIDLINSSGVVIATTQTLADGSYLFTGVAPGVYTVREHQPTDFYDGGEHVGSAGGVASDIEGLYSLFTGIALGSGVDAVRYDFCEHVGPSLSGWVYHDRSNEGEFDRNSEEGISGVVLELLDANGVPTGITTVTSSVNGKVGYYEFTNLAPGTYGVREVQPAGWLDGIDTPGTHGGVAASEIIGRVDRITGAVLNFGDVAKEYNFGELLSGSLAGRVVLNLGPDCDFEDPDGYLEGVQIDLLNANGEVIATTTTDSLGRYKFENLAPGEYSIYEHQPAEYLDGGERIGSLGGLRSGIDDTIFQIFVGSDQHGINYDFCEHTPGSISGRVVVNRGEACDFINPDDVLAGVRIDLLDAQGNLLATTTTGADGTYRFDDLAPGEYQVYEHQPNDYYDGGERIGSAGGERVANDQVGRIALGMGQHAVDYDFCEHIGVNLSGWVYHDRSNEGSFDRDTEEGIGGVTLKLLNADGTDTGRRAVTNNQGYYEFTNIGPGTYHVMQMHPEGWLDGIDTPGNRGGVADPSPGGDMIRQITITLGHDAKEYNFGELLPGSIRGTVYQSTTPGDCLCDPETPRISGVTIELLDESGRVIATTKTDDQGQYAFENLRPGNYTVREIQPVGFFDGGYRLGSGGGTALGANMMGEILVGSEQHLVKYNFCETPPAALSGYVFIDGEPVLTAGALPSDLSAIRDGVRTPDDTPLAGVVIELRHGVSGEPIYADEALPGYYGPGAIRTTTDANGYYQFLGLAAGTYAVVEIQPTGLIDGIDTQGTTGGLAVNPIGAVNDPTTGKPGGITPPEQQAIEQMRLRFGEDVIFRIALPAGAHSQENNFSEIRVTSFWIPQAEDPLIEMPLFPGLPVATPPFLWPLTMPERPNPVIYGGSSGVVGYTWHLSILNAGFPRAIQLDPNVQFQLAADHSAEFDPPPLDQAEWRLGEDSEGGTGQSRVFVFGAPGAKPVVGDWDGDGDDELAVFIDGRWYFDLNGNGRWDSGDMMARLGTGADLPTAGDWDGDGKTDIAIFGPAWAGDPWAIQNEPGLPDAENDPGPIAAKEKNVPPRADEATHGVRDLKLASDRQVRRDLIDHVFLYGVAGDKPIVGDWNGDGIATVGVYRGGVFYLDVDGDGRFTEADIMAEFGEGEPVVGDWNGDGIDDIGVFAAGVWTIDSNGNRQLDARDRVFELGEAGDIPIAGDWDGDGRDEPGIYRPVAAEPEIQLSRRAG